MMKDKPELAERLHPDHPYTAAEVVWIVRNEMPAKIEDVLSRRLRVLLLDAKAAKVMAPKVAQIMATELGENAAWIAEQIADFEKVAAKYTID
jgi:glycerol-3-phosphate dehydrogenase